MTSAEVGDGAIVLLVAIALLACYLRARRAVRVDPVSALRAERFRAAEMIAM